MATGLLLASALGSAGCGDDAKPAAKAEGGESSNGASGGSDDPSPTGGDGALPAGGSSGGDEGGGPGAGTAGEGGAAPVVNPCAGVPYAGECTTPSEARFCVVPTGNGEPLVVTQACRSFEHCTADTLGARCVLNANACIPESSECVGAQTLRTCNAAGQWASTTCPEACRSSPAGAFCAAAITTESYTATLEYEAVPANADLSDWSDQSVFVPAQGVLVLSARGDEVLDSTLVDELGSFTLEVASTASAADRLLFLLLHPDPTGNTVEFGVFDPNVPAGSVEISEGMDGQVWAWEATLASVPAGSTLQIMENEGSGAIHVYNYLRAARQFVTDFYGSSPRTVVAWMHLNTEWSCGACFAPYPTEVQAYPFDSQLFFSATAQDRAYWSDAVMVHEIGHYTMWSYGTSPNEGGQHCLSQPTAPGQAWSEGWATGFSSIMRETPIYFDKQQGSMFWVDLEARQYPDAALWQRPDAAAGLLQDIDENEVAAMLWGLSTHAEVGSSVALAGLQTPSVTQPAFARGYTRHVWDIDNQCRRINVQDTGESAPHFADYLDGLVCEGISAAAVDAITDPSGSYPYPSSSPICP